MRLKSAILSVTALAAAVLPLAAATPAQAGVNANGPSGCNYWVCIYSAYTGSGYQVWAEFTQNITRGHIDFRGPGLSVSSPDGPWTARSDTQRYSASGSGQLCAEGWSYTNGRWNSVGLPCVTID